MPQPFPLTIINVKKIFVGCHTKKKMGHVFWREIWYWRAGSGEEGGAGDSGRHHRHQPSLNRHPATLKLFSTSSPSSKNFNNVWTRAGSMGVQAFTTVSRHNLPDIGERDVKILTLRRGVDCVEDASSEWSPDARTKPTLRTPANPLPYYLYTLFSPRKYHSRFLCLFLT